MLVTWSKALLNNKFSNNNNDDDVDQGAKCKITVLVYSIQLCSIVFTIKNSMIINFTTCIWLCISLFLLFWSPNLPLNPAQSLIDALDS